MPSKAYKLPIKGFLETSFVDWNGYISSVIFLGGCNFRCPFCHNRELVLFPERLENISLTYVIRQLRKYSSWVERVVITGGEPTIHSSLPELLKILRKEGFKIKIDTNGSSPETIKILVGESLVDFVSMDVKGPIDRYEKWCGQDVDKGKIIETINFLLMSGLDYEFRMTFVPSLHTEEDVYQTARFLRGAKRFVVQEFRPRDTINPNFMNLNPYPLEMLDRVRKKVQEIVTT
ncbi:MAG: anaerobic ribonucleoside-triphosphate reductase activating protein [Deltaproteobacteria bacterium]|nr:anaerobic ribonucleoside-triphosphate reductase activating protein [Deltaproteobacteria bacterium]